MSVSVSQNKLMELVKLYKSYNLTNESGKQGVWITYDKEDSTVFAFQTYRNDTLQGYFERYWRTGNLSDYGYFKNGLLDSVFVGFWENGLVRGIANYHNGQLHGIVTSYDQDSKVRSRELFVYGDVDTTWVGKFRVDGFQADVKHIKVDSLITVHSYPWNKSVAIYYNEILVKELHYYNDRIAIENSFINNELTYRKVYRRIAPFTKEKTFYFSSGEVVREEEHHH